MCGEAFFFDFTVDYGYFFKSAPFAQVACGQVRPPVLVSGGKPLTRQHETLRVYHGWSAV